jgi:hypothetical protein
MFQRNILLHLQGWIWRQEVPRKRRYLSITPYVVANQKKNNDTFTSPWEPQKFTFLAPVTLVIMSSFVWWMPQGTYILHLAEDWGTTILFNVRRLSRYNECFSKCQLQMLVVMTGGCNYQFIVQSAAEESDKFQSCYVGCTCGGGGGSKVSGWFCSSHCSRHGAVDRLALCCESWNISQK